MKYTRAAMLSALLAVTGAAVGQSLDQLMRAVNDGNVQGVKELLDRGLEPDSADSNGNTTLMIASRLGHKDVVALLVSRKVNVARRSPFGDTAINYAALGGHLEIVKMLADHGAEIAPATGWGPLHYAAFENRVDVIKYLIQKGAPKDALAPNGFTALMLAARGGHIAAATALLHEDADLGIKAPGGETALSIATSRKDEEMIKLLKRAGAAN
jgi:hypothetical protein